jgi:vacuolar-type H+-ATPase subunit I/STV1
MLWKILADVVTGLHLLLIGFFAVSVVLLATGFFKGRRNWKIFYCIFVALAVGLQVSLSTGILKSCPITDLEYKLRRLYDTSESWLRTRSILATTIFNVTGAEVPEYALTIAMVTGIAVMIISLIFWKPATPLQRQSSERTQPLP